MNSNSHDQKVSRVLEQLEKFQSRPQPLSLKKEVVSHMVPNPNNPKHRYQKIDLSPLNEILEINPVEKTCIAESGVTFSDLVQKTLPLGLIPALVPELKTITLGGAVSGCSVESMSYKLGGFHDSCLEYEVITGEGKIIPCSPQKKPEIFQMIHGSYGTLGILSRLKFRLLPAKRYVRVDYVTYASFNDFSVGMEEAMKRSDVDFIDGILHSPKQNVLCLGRFVEEAPYTSDYTRLNIYYKSTREKKTDYLKTYDYLFRYDTECHWLSRTIPGMETKLLRLLLGKLILSSTNLLTWSQRLGPLLKYDKRPDVVVDLFIPRNQVLRFMNLYREKIGYYPLWIVPYRVPQPYPWLDDNYQKRINDDLFIDIAVYGLKNRRKDVNYYQLIEEMVYDCHGIKTLISHNSYSRERFWEIYNEPNYERVKRETDPHNLFRNLYDKFHFSKQLT
ncbi:MAG: FAD-binding oxidoreductase [Deltaproteobacteria bacterium]|nr:FAD-binding oxidoreductase [Deltaproteobacteria bacterium]